MVDFHTRILFSDEAHFWLNGYVNKQNCRIWSEAEPQSLCRNTVTSRKTDCLVRFMGWWNPSSKTMKATTLQSMVIGIGQSLLTFIPELNYHDVQEPWLQQDGATCHTALVPQSILLKDTFGDHLISRFGPVNWPPRSCDLTPLDYFLWGYVKSLVYADKPQTLDNLEDNIRRVIADIQPQMLEKVIENWTSRLDYIRASHGSPMTENIFKM
ncbi:putative DD41D transposase [Trichonephila clavipes]|nr:putative DD41D transposase [Trichonephila clavipes]